MLAPVPGDLVGKSMDEPFAAVREGVLYTMKLSHSALLLLTDLNDCRQSPENSMSAEDLEAQEDELLALASIYDGDEFRKAESVQGGETRIYLDLPQNFKIFVSG